MPGLYLDIKEFSKLRRRAMRDFYLRPGKVWSTLSATRSPKELYNYLKVGLAQLKELVVG